MPSHLPYNENELLAAVAGGDEKAFGHLLQHYHIKIYQMVLRLTGDNWLSEEVVQDTFLRIWINRSSLKDVTHFDGWLKRVAENITFDAIRRSRRKKNDVTSWVAEFYDSTSLASSPENRLMDIIHQAASRLPARQKEVFTLIKMEGYKREEAALLLKISPETVKSHLEQAMRNVRSYCIAVMNSGGIPAVLLLLAENFFGATPPF